MTQFPLYGVSLTPHRAFPGLSQPESPLPSGVTQTHLAKINISNVCAHPSPCCLIWVFLLIHG